MKVIFLDIDGVLKIGAGVELNQTCVALLREVVEKTDAKLVLSSTWRIGTGGMSRTRGALARAGWADAEFVGMTARHSGISDGGIYVGVRRGDEIAEYLREHPEVEHYVIIDDDSDMRPEQMPFFVKTEFETGLTKALADDLLKKLVAS